MEFELIEAPPVVQKKEKKERPPYMAAWICKRSGWGHLESETHCACCGIIRRRL